MFVKVVVVEKNKRTSLRFPLNHPLSTDYGKEVEEPVFVYKINGSEDTLNNDQLDEISFNTDCVLKSWVSEFPDRKCYEIWECSVKGVKDTNFDTIDINMLIESKTINKKDIIDWLTIGKKLPDEIDDSMIYHNYDPLSKLALGGIKLVRMLEIGNCVTKEVYRY